MDASELKGRQAPIKARHRDDPKAALITLRAGLHPATGGTG